MGEFRYVGTDKLIAKALHAAEDGVRESMRELVVKVKADTPELTGTLAGTTHPEGPRIAGNTVIGIVRQGEGVDYGVIVHENWSGQLRRRAGQVLVPLLRHRRRHIELVRAAVRKAF